MEVKIKCPPGVMLVELLEVSKETNGILDPNSTKQKSQEGKVISFGLPLLKNGDQLPTPALENETVIFRQWTGTEYESPDYPKRKFLFLNFEDVKGIKINA